MAARRVTSLLMAGLLCMSTAAMAIETPLSIYQACLANNPAYKAAQAGQQAEHEGSAIALGQLLPSIALTGNKSRNYADRTTAGRVTSTFDYDGYAHSLNIRQPLYRPYNLAQYRQAGKQGELADSRLEEARHEIILRTISAYLDAVYSDQLSELLGSQKISVEAQAKAAEKAFSAGVGSRIEIDEANSRRDIILAQELEAQNQQEHTRRTLHALAGRPIGTLAQLVPARLSTAMPRQHTLAEWIAAAEAGSAELSSARAQVEVAEQEVNKARAGHHPTLDLVAGRNLSGNESLASLSPLGDTTFRQNTVSLQLSIPIFSGGQTSAAVRQALARLEQARYLAEDVQQNLAVKIRREYSNLVQGALKIRAQEQAETSAAQTVLATRKGVQGGIRSNLDVLKAEEQLYTVRRDLALARYQVILARLKLLALSGKLVDEDIVQISAWFAQEGLNSL